MVTVLKNSIYRLVLDLAAKNLIGNRLKISILSEIGFQNSDSIQNRIFHFKMRREIIMFVIPRLPELKGADICRYHGCLIKAVTEKLCYPR